MTTGNLAYPTSGWSRRWVHHLLSGTEGLDQMADDSEELPFLSADWRRSAEAIAHGLGFGSPAQADDAEWAVILRSVQEAARMRGVTEAPPRWQEALARNVGRT